MKTSPNDGKSSTPAENPMNSQPRERVKSLDFDLIFISLMVAGLMAFVAAVFSTNAAAESKAAASTASTAAAPAAKPAVTAASSQPRPASAPAARKAPTVSAASGNPSPAKPYAVALYKSGIIRLDRPAKRISVGNPGVADILILRSTQLYVVGKALGSTNVTVWDAGDNIFRTINIEVTHDLETLKYKLHELMPDEPIRVYSAQERLVLNGQVSSAARMNAAVELAKGFLPECIKPTSGVVMPQGSTATPVIIQQGGGASTQAQGCKQGEVVNMMQVGGAQQVMLKITVAEMSRDLTKRLDSSLNFFNFGNKFSGGLVNGGASFPNALDPDGLLTPAFGDLSGAHNPVGPPVSLYQPNTPTIDGPGMFLSYLSGDSYLQAVLDISRRNGMAKILSEPTLTTLTGQEAQFLSGGEFPIPVPQGGGINSVTIEFKEFGVGVKFLPVILDSGRINMTLNVNVSELSSDSPVVLNAAGTSSTFLIPSLTKRSASSTVELANGQTIGIAGLINDNVRQFVSKFPGLGDIPILGALFRSQEYRAGQTELVIFVTPHLARPIAASAVRLPTDSFAPASDLEFYLMGRTEAKNGNKLPKVAPVVPRSAEAANFGHDM